LFTGELTDFNTQRTGPPQRQRYRPEALRPGLIDRQQFYEDYEAAVSRRGDRLRLQSWAQSRSWEGRVRTRRPWGGRL